MPEHFCQPHPRLEGKSQSPLGNQHSVSDVCQKFLERKEVLRLAIDGRGKIASDHICLSCLS